MNNTNNLDVKKLIDVAYTDVKGFTYRETPTSTPIPVTSEQIRETLDTVIKRSGYAFRMTAGGMSELLINQALLDMQENNTPRTEALDKAVDNSDDLMKTLIGGAEAYSTGFPGAVALNATPEAFEGLLKELGREIVHGDDTRTQEIFRHTVRVLEKEAHRQGHTNILSPETKGAIYTLARGVKTLLEEGDLSPGDLLKFVDGKNLEVPGLTTEERSVIHNRSGPTSQRQV